MSIFDEFEKFMRRWQKFFEEIERQIEEDFRRFSSQVGGGRPRYYYYGFEITVGPDGRPVVREFGNVRRRPDVERIEVVDEIDPLTDIVEEDDKIKVVVDMPGVEKEDIKLYISEDGKTLTIDARGKERKYHKEIRLPAAVDPNKAKATYKNGVLSVELEKVEKKKRGFEIKID
ncbi:heat shock protein Hsp20 [Pyrobaculum islandicum DSM 4184]|uniref:Heat shock protein Hsp20 n=1 Tax=Pyrobaculum islandicum (strain DSM 4184 / JCM 9189 / GEO3) TaxID=384616 RepID=A1RRY3_PYRIL|nr:archaeal heat shock protein Hsp20 [Pyrobaculum islandicum]ABL87715.1 heat shock protein Hsp20 [Pyrobaculum islandicum DSM 4184]